MAAPRLCDDAPLQQLGDPVRDKPRPFRAGKDGAGGVAVLGFQCGVCCCSMYCRTMEIGAPPQEDAK